MPVYIKLLWLIMKVLIGMQKYFQAIPRTGKILNLENFFYNVV
jgi:hypothetical protein